MTRNQAVGNRYQQVTKYVRGKLPRRGLDRSREPSVYKEYRNPLALERLPTPTTEGGRGLWETIAARRSRRRFEGPITLEALSQLLWATQGITCPQAVRDLRASPSAGALYPLETYLVANAVEGLQPGVWHYRVRDHALELLRSGDFSLPVAEAALDQPMAMRAAAVFIWTAIVERSTWKYGQRGYRYMYLDAGHVGGQLHLAAEALGLNCCAIGALYDDEVNALVEVDGVEETVLYMSVVGPGDRAT